MEHKLPEHIEDFLRNSKDQYQHIDLISKIHKDIIIIDDLMDISEGRSDMHDHLTDQMIHILGLKVYRILSGSLK